MKTSLILSTYNRPDALRLCLLSAFVQTRLPDEIVVGDDGSGPETRRVIDELRKISPVPLIHVWHEDKGFRLAMMRNKCVAASSGEYIVEVDGDVILDRRFIADHLRFASPGHYLKGGRTNLGPGLTDRLCAEGELPSTGFFMRGIEAKRENALHLPRIARWLAPRYRRHKEPALGCNMSFYRSDYEAVNGYDEFYEGWGGEDGDFGRRLNKLGLTKLHLKFAGNVFHLWHEDKHMQNKEKNFAHSLREEMPARCERGLDQYSGSKGSGSFTVTK